MAMEFITFLLRCGVKDDFDNYIKENGYIQNDEIKKYLQYAQENASIFLKNDLEILIKDFRINFYYPVMLIANNNIESVEDFIVFFKGIDGKDYLKQCLRLYKLDITMESKDTDILERVTELRNKKEAELLLEFKRNPEEMKKRLDDLFEKFYLSIFQKFETEIEKELF